MTKPCQSTCPHHTLYTVGLNRPESAKLLKANTLALNRICKLTSLLKSHGFPKDHLHPMAFRSTMEKETCNSERTKTSPRVCCEMEKHVNVPWCVDLELSLLIINKDFILHCNLVIHLLCNQKCPLRLDQVNMQQFGSNREGQCGYFVLINNDYTLRLYLVRLPHLRRWQDKTSWKCSCLEVGVCSSSTPPSTKSLFVSRQVLWESRKLSASQLALPKHTATGLLMRLPSLLEPAENFSPFSFHKTINEMNETDTWYHYRCDLGNLANHLTIYYGGHGNAKMWEVSVSVSRDQQSVKSLSYTVNSVLDF